MNTKNTLIDKANQTNQTLGFGARTDLQALRAYEGFALARNQQQLANLSHGQPHEAVLQRTIERLGQH